MQISPPWGSVGDDYDDLLCDHSATESDHLSNSIYPTRNHVLPVELSWKGQTSVEGPADVATNFADQLNIDVGVLAVIPNGVKNTADQREMLGDVEVSTPEVIGNRTSLIEGCWKQQCSAFRCPETPESASGLRGRDAGPAKPLPVRSHLSSTGHGRSRR